MAQAESHTLASAAAAIARPWCPALGFGFGIDPR
jgi:hypothetical protein